MISLFKKLKKLFFFLKKRERRRKKKDLHVDPLLDVLQSCIQAFWKARTGHVFIIIYTTSPSAAAAAAATEESTAFFMFRLACGPLVSIKTQDAVRSMT